MQCVTDRVGGCPAVVAQWQSIGCTIDSIATGYTIYGCTSQGVWPGFDSGSCWPFHFPLLTSSWPYMVWSPTPLFMVNWLLFPPM